MSLNPYTPLANNISIPPAGPQGLTTTNKVAAYMLANTGMGAIQSQVMNGIVYNTADGAESSTYNMTNGVWTPNKGTYLVNFAVSVTGANRGEKFRTSLQNTAGQIVRIGGVVGTGSSYYAISASAVIVQTGTTHYQVVAELLNGTSQVVMQSDTDAMTVAKNDTRFDVWRIA